MSWDWYFEKDEDPVFEMHLRQMQKSARRLSDPSTADEALEVSREEGGLYLAYPLLERLPPPARDRVLRAYLDAAGQMHGVDPVVQKCRGHLLKRATKLLEPMWGIRDDSKTKAV